MNANLTTHSPPMRILKSLLVWLCLIPVAILNGGLREHLLCPLVGQSWALPLSGLSLSLLIFFVTWTLLPLTGRFRRGECLAVAILWPLLTAAFELLTGLSSGFTLKELAEAYNPSTGNLWLLVILSTAISPIVTIQYRRKA